MSYLVFKPDGIGDFVLATGAIRLLAEECGEAHLTLVVMPPVRSLAQAQFPKATVIVLPMEPKRRVVNVFVMNFLRCFGAQRQIRKQRHQVAVSLRAMRAYLHTFLFYSTRAERYCVAENLLARNRRWSRRFVEWAAQTLFTPQIAPYPAATEAVPTELEAHRRVLSLTLNREVTLTEILPRLQAQATPASGGYWLCCPLSAISIKNYPFEKWREVLDQCRDLIGEKEIRLTGSPEQRDQLEIFANQLSAAHFSRVSVDIRPALQDFVELIQAAEWVLTIDTAAAHLACALNCRCLILFSGMHHGMFAPWSRSDRQLWLEPVTPTSQSAKWHRAMPPDHVSAAIHRLSAIPHSD